MMSPLQLAEPSSPIMGVIIIHPEGLCVNEKRVRPLRKGIGRIAFGAEEENNWNLNLKIVPVALNYTNASQSR